MTRRRRAIVVRLLVATGLALAPPLACAAASGSGPDQVTEGAKQTGKGIEETAKGVGKTAKEGASAVGQRAARAGEGADAVGSRLHSSAKQFGDALLDGVKFAGRTVIRFFTGSR